MATDIEMAFPSLPALGYTERHHVTRTLVVDDTPDFLNAVCAVLEERPDIRIVGTATNGLEALRAAEELCPDLILLDLNMPVMNGLQAAARLSEEMPWITILMMSADDDPETEAACLECGADAFLWKGRLAQGLEARLGELAPQPHAQAIQPGEMSEAEKTEIYEFHNQSYEIYRTLLEYAQTSESRTLAISAARMLLFHLRQMFRCLPAPRQQIMKFGLALAEA